MGTEQRPEVSAGRNKIPLRYKILLAGAAAVNFAGIIVAQNYDVLEQYRAFNAEEAPDGVEVFDGCEPFTPPQAMEVEGEVEDDDEDKNTSTERRRSRTPTSHKLKTEVLGQENRR